MEAQASEEPGTRMDPSPEPANPPKFWAAVQAAHGWMVDWGGAGTDPVVAWLFFTDSTDLNWVVYPSTSTQVLGPGSPPYTLIGPP